MQIRKSHVISGTLALLLVGATATAWYYASQARTPEQIAEESEPPDDSIITVPVEEGQLLDEFVINGEAQRTGDIDVNVASEAAEGEVAITSELPLDVGDDVENGTVLMEVSGRPLIALEGEIPAYRDLVEGESEGPDVEQLQEALQNIYGTPVTGRFDARTASDVRQLYDGRGYTAPTGSPNAPPGMGEEHEDGIAPENEAEGDATTVPADEIAFVPEFPVQVGEIEADLAAPLPEEGVAMVLVGGTWQVEAELTEEELQDLRSLENDAELVYGAGPLEDEEVPDFELQEREVEGDEFNEGGVEDYVVFEFDSEELDNATPGESQSVRIIRARSDEGALIAPLSAVWTNSDEKSLVTVRESGDEERHVEVDVVLQHEGTGVLEPVDGDLALGDEVVIAFRDRGN